MPPAVARLLLVRPASTRINELSLTMDDKMGAAELLVREHLNLTARGDLAVVEKNVTSDFFNHRCADEPMETRRRGPEGLRATIRWLHRAFTDMHFEFHEVVVVGDRAVARVTFHARRHDPFVVHDSPNGEMTNAFPSNGRSIAVSQTHWFRISKGAIAE